MHGPVVPMHVFLCAQKMVAGVFARAQPHVVFVVVVAGRQSNARVQHWQRRARNMQTPRWQYQNGMDIESESLTCKSHEGDVTVYSDTVLEGREVAAAACLSLGGELIRTGVRLSKCLFA